MCAMWCAVERCTAGCDRLRQGHGGGVTSEVEERDQVRACVWVVGAGADMRLGDAIGGWRVTNSGWWVAGRGW